MQSIAVIFDMDGLMLDTERMSHSAWMRALSERNLAIEPSAYLDLIGRTSQDTQQIVSELFGPSVQFPALRSRIQYYYDVDIEQNGIPTKPGLFDLFDFLEQQGIPRAIATSATSEFAARKLRIAGIDDRFSTIVTSDMVAHGKPSPDLFLEAARRIDIPANLCVVLEDSEPGIRAAKAAGMLAVMVPDMKHPSEEIQAMCYSVLPSLKDVIPMLEGFLQNGLPA